MLIGKMINIFYFFTLLIVFFLIHCRGIETIVVDYLRPKIVGATVAKMGVVLVYLISAFTLGGLFYFNYSDVGIVNAVKMLWKL
jgi:succinate dehydrogenase (ubiquinone) membrane anchor subunit